MNEEFARTLGPEFEAEPQLSFETNTGTQRQEFRVTGTMFKVEIFLLSEDPHDQERFRRRKAVNVGNRQMSDQPLRLSAFARARRTDENQPHAFGLPASPTVVSFPAPPST